MTDRKRLSLALPIPSNFELIAARVVLVALIAGGAGLYLKGHADGYTKAEAIYVKLMAQQAAANKTAIDAAHKQLLETASSPRRCGS